MRRDVTKRRYAMQSLVDGTASSRDSVMPADLPCHQLVWWITSPGSENSPTAGPERQLTTFEAGDSCARRPAAMPPTGTSVSAPSESGAQQDPPGHRSGVIG